MLSEAAVAPACVVFGAFPVFAPIGLGLFVAVGDTGTATREGARISDPIELPGSFAMLPGTVKGITVTVDLTVGTDVDVGIAVAGTGVAAQAVETALISVSPTAIMTTLRRIIDDRCGEFTGQAPLTGLQGLWDCDGRGADVYRTRLATHCGQCTA